jgi:hypothetical protein
LTNRLAARAGGVEVYRSAAMEANHPHLTTQKSFYVEISRARDRAELVSVVRDGNPHCRPRR